MTCTAPQLLEAVTRVLETAAFMMVEPSAPETCPDALGARLTFNGPLTGSIGLVAPRGLAEAVAAGLLGCDPADPCAAENARDALGELLNMVAGVLAGLLLGDGAPCPLGPPQVADAAPKSEPGALEVHLRVDDQYPLRLSVDVRARGGGGQP